MVFKKYFLIIILSVPGLIFSQTGDHVKKLKFTGDFRFRVEQDWSSRKSDGTYRDDRSRLRYRVRFGMNYQYNDWASFGLRIRTGFREKQQDPQLTLGEGFGEFSTLPIGFEKLFFRAKYKWLDAWVGKNTFPFEKLDELFWSDNVFPEGIFASATFDLSANVIDALKISGSHFVVRSSGSSFSNDRYLHVMQLLTTHWNNRIRFYPSFYYFHQMPDIPDGNETYSIDYSILQLGVKTLVFKKPYITFGMDYYHNFKNYDHFDEMDPALRDQKTGFVGKLGWGKFTEKGDFTLQIFYTYLERYAAVDFLTQNDWARWDYSSQGSPDGRLTNFKGTEIRAGYKVGKKFTLIMRYFMVDQIIPYGPFKETGNRIRLDLNIGF